MAARITKSEGDRYAELLKQERIRHGRVENQFLRVITDLEKQVKTLTAQAQELRSAYVTSIATNFRTQGKP